MEDFNHILEKLDKPSSRYRSAPFWAWNDNLDSKRLVEQIELMRREGVGGFFIHSREGLETPYLSTEWMNHVETVLFHAEQSDLEVWIYDEDTWPSGSAGGAVSGTNPQEFSAKGVTIELLSFPIREEIVKLGEDKDIIAIYQIVRDDSNSSRLTHFHQVKLGNDYKDENSSREFLICRKEVSGSSEWYNNHAPSNNLNPDAVKSFIEKTHQSYAKQFKKDFGKGIKGFFTDEPNICDFFAHYTQGRPWLPWSELVPTLFEEKNGYPLFDILPLLFLEGPHMEKARYDFWYTLTELFVSSYTRQLYQWCEENDLKLTGHMLYENDLGYSVRCNGAVMPHYRYMHAPGIDLLGDQRKEYLTVKQCTSVANQFRREMVVSEMYGCTGWDFSFAGQKRVGDWQYVMGVTRRCQHLALYSISGCRKRDYPPAFNYQSSWWEHDHILESYFSHLGICTTAGEVHRDILVIHPIGTFWMHSGSSLNEDLSKIYMNMGWLDEGMMDLNKAGDYYNHLTEQLLKCQWDFDFGDELILRDSGSVHDNHIEVGYHRYSYVIVPPLETLMESTRALLHEFLEAGGQIFWMKPFPTRIDAVESTKIAKLISHDRVYESEDFVDLTRQLSHIVKRPVRICNSFNQDIDGLLSMTRKVESGLIIIITNTCEYPLDDTTLEFSTLGSLSRYDLFSGKFSSMAVYLNSSEENMRIRTSFEIEETQVYFINRDEKPECLYELPSFYHHPHAGVDLIYAFPVVSPITLTKENALTLDRCKISFGDENFSEELPVWVAQKKLRERLKMQPIYYNGAPQRYLWINDEKSYSISLQFSFIVDVLPEEPIYVVVEKSQDMTIQCNGNPCFKADSYFIDQDFLKHQIWSLTKGENIIQLDISYTTAIELEDIYITGIFGVSPERHIVSTPTKLRRGDWTLQGLFHYPGSCRYQYTIPNLKKVGKGKNLMLKLGKFNGSLAIVHIAGKEPQIVFQESSIPLSGLICTDSETPIEIEIVGNLRNLLGPLHRSANVCTRISWEDFHPSGPNSTPSYIVEPMGLLGEVYIYGGNRESSR